MTRDEVNALCLAMGWPTKGYRDGWVIAPCPLAPWRHGRGSDSNPSFAIKCDDAPGKNVCLACDWGGSLMDLFGELVRLMPVGSAERKQAVQIMNGIPVTQLKEPLMPAKTEEKPTADPYFPTTWLDSFPLAHKVGDCIRYCHGRGISTVEMEGMDMRYDPTSNRICFPIRDWNDNLRGLQGRTLGDGKPPYLFYKYKGVACGHEVLLGESELDTAKPVLVLEGAFDRAALYTFTKQTLVLWGLRVTPGRLARLKRLTKIYTCFDNDEAGDRGRARMLETGLDVTNLKPYKSVNDVAAMDSSGRKELAKAVDDFGKL